MPLADFLPGKRFSHVSRPLGIAAAFPFRVAFQRLHIVEAQHHKVRRHQHPHYEIMLIEDGSYICVINDTRIMLQARGIAVIKPGDWHEDCCESATKFMSLAFAVQPGPGMNISANLFHDRMPITKQVLENSDALHAICRLIHEEADWPDAFSTPLQDALTLQFVCALARSVGEDYINPRLRTADPNYQFASALLSVFEANLGASIGLHEIAREMAMSERSLSDRCRVAFNTSPTRLFVRFKMEKARVLLLQTDCPIKEISCWLGFENPYHFSTVYKRVHGQPPTTHRGEPI